MLRALRNHASTEEETSHGSHSTGADSECEAESVPKSENFHGQIKEMPIASDSLSVERIEFLPDQTLPTAQMLGQGQNVSLRAHIKDIMQHYDIVRVPQSFLEGIHLPESGRFFLIKPED